MTAMTTSTYASLLLLVEVLACPPFEASPTNQYQICSAGELQLSTKGVMISKRLTKTKVFCHKRQVPRLAGLLFTGLLLESNVAMVLGSRLAFLHMSCKASCCASSGAPEPAMISDTTTKKLQLVAVLNGR